MHNSINTHGACVIVYVCIPISHTPLLVFFKSVGVSLESDSVAFAKLCAFRVEGKGVIPGFRFRVQP